MLWRKQTPIQMDGNFCPVCGTMQFIADIGYCKVCGQALKHNENPSTASGPPPFNKGGKVPSRTSVPFDKGGSGDEEESEVDMLSDINDRS